MISNPMLLAIDKPEGWTSFDAVNYLRKSLNVKRVGHGGTLDPFATGLLIIGIGREATRSLDEVVGHEKVYVTTMQFGVGTDSHDLTGNVVIEKPVPDEETLRAILPRFIGEVMQVPPQHSAIKKDGQRAYKAARRNETIVLDARPVTIRSIDWLNWSAPDLTVRITCSKGTYIRAIARDWGDWSGSAAMLRTLRRERIGEYDIAVAVSPREAVKRLRAGEADAPFIVKKFESLAEA